MILHISRAVLFRSIINISTDKVKIPRFRIIVEVGKIPAVDVGGKGIDMSFFKGMTLERLPLLLADIALILFFVYIFKFNRNLDPTIFGIVIVSMGAFYMFIHVLDARPDLRRRIIRRK